MSDDFPDGNIYIVGDLRNGIERFPVRNPATNEMLVTVAEAGGGGCGDQEFRCGPSTTRLASIPANEWHSYDASPIGYAGGRTDWCASSAKNGRLLSQPRSVVKGTASYFDYYAGIVDSGETIPLPGARLDYR